VILEQYGDELPQNYEILSSIFLDTWNYSPDWVGEDTSFHYSDGSSVTQFQLFYASWIMFVPVILNNTEQIWIDVGSRNCKNTKIIHWAVTETWFFVAGYISKWFALYVIAEMLFICVCPGNVTVTDICHMNEMEAKWSSNVL
jgi:predicted metal-binding membrane protein